VNLHIGTIYELRGGRDRALRQYLTAYDILARTPDKWHWVKACFSIGEVYMSMGAPARAKNYLYDGLKAAVEIRSPSYIEQAYALLSDYHYALGDYRTSRDELQSSRQWADTVHHNLEANLLLESRIQYETVGYTRRIEELDETVGRADGRHDKCCERAGRGGGVYGDAAGVAGGYSGRTARDTERRDRIASTRRISQ
jgi:tetratricopeptide (TPR) repeat protein